MVPSSTAIGASAVTPPEYTTWVDIPEIDVRYDGVDVRAVLLALDLLRTRNSAYEGIRFNNVHSIPLVKRMFELEFGTGLPPTEMLRGMGAKIRSHDAESALIAIRDTASPY